MSHSQREVTEFFVPGVTPENQKEGSAEFAKWCGAHLPAPERRLYSITFTHVGEEWTATATGSEPLIGVRNQWRKTKTGGWSPDREIRLSDPTIVLAIFASVLYLVVTNHRITGNVGSTGENARMNKKSPYLLEKCMIIGVFTGCIFGIISVLIAAWMYAPTFGGPSAFFQKAEWQILAAPWAAIGALAGAVICYYTNRDRN